MRPRFACDRFLPNPALSWYALTGIQPPWRRILRDSRAFLQMEAEALYAPATLAFNEGKPGRRRNIIDPCCGRVLNCESGGRYALPANLWRFAAMNPRAADSTRSPGATGSFSFGPFRLIPGQQLLLEDGVPVHIGSRALLLLTALVENAGELVSKSDLIARAWPDAVVDESNLKVHIAALRRALGDGLRGNRYLATISGRGYIFVAPVEYVEQKVSARRNGAAQAASRLPAIPTNTIGRTDAIERLGDALSRQRLVTVVGPGGIGKTAVALCTAQGARESYAHGVSFVDLGSVADPGAFSATVATALGLIIRSADKRPAILAHLRERQMLIVLDTCEHVIDEAALFVEQVMRGAPNVAIMATSRQSLRASGEYLHRLLPLPSPPDAIGLTASEALTFPAVQLFADRAATGQQGFALSDENAPIVGEICRSLDGLPLAIELVATRFDAFGLLGLSLLLDDSRRLLSQSRRTTLLRHRTLAGALEWSYELLPRVERTILRRLSLFASPFTLEAASALAEDGEITTSDVISGVAQLVEKSLLSADVSGSITRYRLLNTTRAYALQKLADGGELEAITRRYAERLPGLFAPSQAKGGMQPRKKSRANTQRKQ